jgi:hypothetical protein
MKKGHSYYEKKYKGKRFRYNSEYGIPLEGILCTAIVVRETMSLSRGDLDLIPLPAEIILISDKGNSYDLEKVEFYE